VQLALVPDVQCATNPQPRNVVCVIEFRINVLTSHPLSIFWSSRFTRPGLIYISGEKKINKNKNKGFPGCAGRLYLPFPFPCLLACLPACLPHGPSYFSYPSSHRVTSHPSSHHHPMVFVSRASREKSVRRIYLGAPLGRRRYRFWEIYNT
jgi:hypothetical protein